MSLLRTHSEESAPLGTPMRRATVSAVSPVGTSADTGKQCEARTVSEAATRLTHGGEDRRCERRYVLDVVNSATMYSSARDHATFSPWAYAIDNAQSFEGAMEHTGEQYAGAPPWCFAVSSVPPVELCTLPTVASRCGTCNDAHAVSRGQWPHTTHEDTQGAPEDSSPPRIGASFMSWPRGEASSL